MNIFFSLLSHVLNNSLFNMFEGLEFLYYFFVLLFLGKISINKEKLLLFNFALVCLLSSAEIPNCVYTQENVAHSKYGFFFFLCVDNKLLRVRLSFYLNQYGRLFVAIIKKRTYANTS